MVLRLVSSSVSKPICHSLNGTSVYYMMFFLFLTDIYLYSDSMGCPFNVLNFMFHLIALLFTLSRTHLIRLHHTNLFTSKSETIIIYFNTLFFNLTFKSSKRSPLFWLNIIIIIAFSIIGT